MGLAKTAPPVATIVTPSSQAAVSNTSYAGVVGPGQTLPLSLAGTNFYLSVATAPLFVRTSGQAWSLYQPGTGANVGAFSVVELYNASANAITFQINVGTSQFIDHRMVPYLQALLVTHLVASEDGYGWAGSGPSWTTSLPDLSGLPFQTGQYVNPTVEIVGAGGSGATFTLTVTNGLISAITIATPGSGLTNGVYTTPVGLYLIDDTGSGASLSVTVAGGVATAASVISGGNPPTNWVGVRRVSLFIQTQDYRSSVYLSQTLNGGTLAIIQSVSGTSTSPSQIVGAPFQLAAAGTFYAIAENAYTVYPSTSIWEIYEAVAPGSGLQGTPPG